MRPQLSSLLRVASIGIAASCLLVGVRPSSATAATSAPVWGALKTLATSGGASAYPDARGGSLLYQTNGGYPSITPISATGKLGAPTTLPPGAKGKAYSSTMKASGGMAPYAWTRTAGLTPPGLSLSGKPDQK